MAPSEEGGSRLGGGGWGRGRAKGVDETAVGQRTNKSRLSKTGYLSSGQRVWYGLGPTGAPTPPRGLSK